MQNFSTDVLTQAATLVAASSTLPAWLSQAREALDRYEPSPEGGRKLMGELLAIADWPNREAMDEALLLAAQPVAQLAARSFCAIGKDESGRPVARLWGSQASVAVENGQVLLSSTNADEPFNQVALSTVFNKTEWDGSPPVAPSEQNARLNVMLRGFPTAGAVEKETLIYTPSPFKAALGKISDVASKANGNPQAIIAIDGSGSYSEPARVPFEKGLGSLLMGLEGASAEARLRDARARESSQDLNTLSSLFRDGRNGTSISEALSSARAGWGNTADEPLDEARAGSARALQLENALSRVGGLSLLSARARAGAELVDFLEAHCPSAVEAEVTSRLLWDIPMSMAALGTAQSWLPLAARLTKEDPRRARLAFALAPALGIAPSMSMLSDTKAELKKLGFSEGAWKELSRLPEESFTELLERFKAVARELVVKKEKFDPDPASSAWVMSVGRGGIAIDPFAPSAAGANPEEREAESASLRAFGTGVWDAIGGRQDRPALTALQVGPAAKLRNLARQCAFSFEVAQESGLGFDLALGLCLSVDPEISIAWRKELRRAAGGEGSAADLPPVAPGRGRERTRIAASELVAFCLIERGAETQAGRPEVYAQMEQRELEAAAVKGPKVLALAAREAMKRPLGQVLDELANLTDWFRRSEAGLWQELPQQLTWAALRRREQAWHVELAAEKDRAFIEPWAPILTEPLASDGLSVVELKNGRELFEEGKAMHHCVSSYAGDCRSGVCRVYSIRDETGVSLATMEARLESDPSAPEEPPTVWCAQLRGPCNEEILPGSRIDKVARVSLEALNEKARLAYASEPGEPPKTPLLEDFYYTEGKAAVSVEISHPAPDFLDFHKALARRRGASPPELASPAGAKPA